MRTINEKLHNRLIAQAEEAKLLGLKKVSENLSGQIVKQAVRSNEVFYSYAADDLKKDVETALWDAVVRISDYYNSDFDGKDMNKIVESFATLLLDEVRVKVGSSDSVGAFEPILPGEEKSFVTIEVSEEI